MLSIPTQEVDSVTQDLRKISIDSSTSQWKEISHLKVGPGGQRHKGSLQISTMSGISEDSRRFSFFAEAESQLTKILSEDSDEHVDEEEKRGARPEEVFTDKARAAMVVIGTKDIKDALDRKKAVEIFRKTPEARSAAIYFQQARFLVHQSRYKEALVFLNKALKVDPERKEWLTERSLCYFKMLEPETALKHVDEVLDLDPKYFQALLLKGEILYSMWDLERAMLCFVEGRRLRPDNTECIRGVHKIRMALEEISVHRDTKLDAVGIKSKSRRSKSAKERLISLSSGGSVPKSTTKASRRHLYSSEFTSLSDRSSSVFSYEDDKIINSGARRPVTAHVRKRAYKTTLELRTSTSEAKTTGGTISHQSDKKKQTRPKTAVERRVESPIKFDASEDWLENTVSNLDDGICPSRFVKSNFSSKGRENKPGKTKQTRPNTTIGSRNESPIKACTSKDCLESTTSDESSNITSTPSFSSSGEDASNGFERKPFRRTKRARNREATMSVKKSRPVSSIGPKVTASLEKDRHFLESILKNKGLKRAKTSYTKRALRIARDLHKFVMEREEFWRNREIFIRYAKKDENIFTV